MASKTSSPVPTGSKSKLLAMAAKLPLNPDRAVAFPMGSSTFRALMVDRDDKMVDQFELSHPADHYQDLTHAIAAALLRFGCRPMAGAAFLAGMVPRLGLLEFTNLKGWPKFDRADTEKYFGFKMDWMNDGQAGFYGLSKLNSRDFVTLKAGGYKPGDNYIYAIFGTGMNVGTKQMREDAHLLFVPRSDDDRDLQKWFRREQGHWPEWEDVASGGAGFGNVAEFYLHHHKLPADDPFRVDFRAAAKGRGEVVTTYALKGHKSARAAASKAFEYLGSWLGEMAIAHQALRIDVSPGILSYPAMRELCLKESDFLGAFLDQGRPMFKAVPEACTIRVCLRNPEHEGATERAAELLRAAG